MEPIRHASIISLEDPSQIGLARRTTQELGRLIGLSEEERGRAEIVAVELANNVLQHARPNPAWPAGKLFVSTTPSATALQIIAADQGPGMADPEACLRDGFSTASTPGLGLGSVQRMAQQFDMYSTPGKGTVVSAIVGAAPSRHGRNPLFPTAVLSLALPGEDLNGDSWAVSQNAAQDLFFLVDGLGHGLYAFEAANTAIGIFVETTASAPLRSPAELMQQIHGPMRATRGAAVVIVAVDRSRGQVECCGVGNISCLLQAPDGRSQSMVSHNGTVGYQMPRVQTFTYPYTPGTLLVMHSDGIATHWNFAKYANLSRHTAATVAGVLYRDAWRGRDDATILVTRLD